MTQNTFLAVVLLNVDGRLYPTTRRSAAVGIDPLDDQRLAAGCMWIAGDAIFLTAIMAARRRVDAVRGAGLARADRQADVDLARIRVRERRLAERLAEERGAVA
jgi:hypothetical protein